MRFEDLVTIEEAREVMGVTRTRIYQLVYEGKLKPAVELPRKKFFMRKDLERLRDEIVPRRKRSG
jgi:predicted site-specific integrase-resolvase